MKAQTTKEIKHLKSKLIPLLVKEQILPRLEDDIAEYASDYLGKLTYPYNTDNPKDEKEITKALEMLIEAIENEVISQIKKKQ